MPADAAAQDASTGPRPLVLVVDDERAMRETIAYNLRRAGIDVVVAPDGGDVLSLARARRPALILLDVLLPGGGDGFELCRLLRREHTCPIIFVSALDSEIDRVVGLEVGADDYVVKPFSMPELVAPVRARLRRVELWSMPAPTKAGQATVDPPVLPTAPSRVNAGEIALDVARREVTVWGKYVHLKRREFDLLLYLARHPGMIFSRDRLLSAVWGESPSPKRDSRTVDAHVRRLREKIEKHPSKPRHLFTVRGFGYSLRTDSAA